MRAIFIGGRADGTRQEIPDDRLKLGVVEVPYFINDPLPATVNKLMFQTERYYVKTFILEDGPMAILAFEPNHYAYLARLIQRYPKPRKRHPRYSKSRLRRLYEEMSCNSNANLR